MNGVQYDSLVMNELRINIKTAGLGILRKAINHTKMKEKCGIQQTLLAF